MLSDSFLKDFYASAWTDAIGVTIQDIQTVYLKGEQLYRTLFIMTHPLLPKQRIYSVIEISDKVFDETKEDTSKFVGIIDREQLLAIEKTRKYIKEEVDKLIQKD